MAKKNLTKQVLTAAFAVAGLTLSGNDVQAMGMPASNTDLTKTNIMLSPQESQELNIKSDIKFLGANRFSKSSKIFSSRGAGVNTNVLSRSGRSLSMTGTPTGAAAPTPTLYSIKTDSEHYLDVEGGHKTYTLSTAEGSNTHSIYINGIKYWYTPNEEAKGGYTADQLNSMLVNLANTGSAALNSTDVEPANYVFKIDNIYYYYDKTKLPTSAYTTTTVEASPSNYNFITYNGTTPQHNLINVDVSRMKTATDTGALTWTKNESQTGSYSDSTTFPKMSTINYDTDGSGNRTAAGEVRFQLPGTGNVNQYYSFNYTSSGSKNNRVPSLTEDINGGYFYNNNPTNDVGGAISNTNTADNLNITADFIKNSCRSSSQSYGGAIYNGGTINLITGDFIENKINNSYARGGAIYNNAEYTAVQINSIVGNFIGNSVKSGFSDPYGGAIANYGSKARIGSIRGDFIGNYAEATGSRNSYGGAIYNDYGTMSSIIGNFIGNSAHGGGAISSYVGAIGSITGDFIGNSAISGGGAIHIKAYSNNLPVIDSITGDFIGNSTGYNGGAIYSFKGVISSITGNFIGNHITSNSSSGGAIYNYRGTISSMTGDFIGNHSTKLGGAIYNDGETSAIITLNGNTFTGNYVDNNGTQTPNSIYNAGVINIANGATVTINDGYNGTSGAQLKIGTGTSSGSIFNLSVDNNYIQTDNLGTVTNNGTINWDLDVDLTGNQSDNLLATSISGTNSSIIINAINLMSDKEGETEITFVSGSPIASYILSDTLATNGILHGDYIYTVAYNNGTGVLTFNGTEAPFVSGGATIDDIRVASEEYLALDDTAHAQYDDLVTTKNDAHPDVVVINGTTYYFKADESAYDEDNTDVLRNLAATGSSALKEVTASDNWIFSAGGKYYTYTAKSLPKSIFETTTDGASASNYNYITKDSDGNNVYHLVNLRPKYMTSDKKTTWTKLSDGSGYTWSDTTTFPKISTINYTTDGSGNLTKVDGAVRFKLPGAGDNLEQYYKFEFTPTGDKQAQITSLSGDVEGGYFYGLSKSSGSGGAISNTSTADYSITADFIGNSSFPGESYGGAISNYAYNSTASIGSIVGDFVGNSSSSYGGAISSYAYNGTASIGSIVGDFVGNSSSSSSGQANGGAIYNRAFFGTALASIGSIVGDFVGNYASSSSGQAYGGAINNYCTTSATIGSIVGDFVGNYASSSSSSNAYGGAINNNTFSNNKSSATIGSIVGDFVGNYASSSSSSGGGAIYNYASSTGTASIGSIVGDFVGNYASSSSANGGAISNKAYTTTGTASIGSIVGDFVGNYASSSSSSSGGGAIYNYASSNKGSATIGSIVGYFVGNYAKTSSTSYKAYGGAIYNGNLSSGNPSYNANSKITLGGNTFTGNYVQQSSKDPVPNSIYNAGVINIANGATVTINDGYDGLGEAQLNIGTSASSGSVFNLSVDNGTIQTDNLGTVTNNGTINWDLDVDLTSTDANKMSDKITFTSLNGGSIIIRAINLLNDKAGSTAITIADSSLSGKYSLSSAINEHITSPGNFAYTATYSGGVLTLNQVILDSLALKVHDDDPERSYEMTKIENVGENLGDLVGEGAKLSVNGGGYSIVGGEWEGINVASGQTLEFENVSDVTGFYNGVAVTNAGTLNIKDSKFTSDIINTNELNLNSTNTTTSINTFDGEIGMGTASTGTINVETGKTLFNDTVTQADMTVASGAQVEIGAGNLVITNAVQNDGTVTLTGGTVASFAQLNSSIANKTEELTTPKTVIDGFVNVGNGKKISQAIEINEYKALSANVNSVGGSVTNNGDLAIYDYENSESNHFAQSVTGNGTTTIQRNVIVDSTIANNIIIDKFEGTSPAVTHYADVVVGSTGLLGAEGTTITVNANNQLTMATGGIAADSITNNGTLILNNSTDGEIGKAINGTSGVLSINTTGTNAANVTVTANSTLTNQAVSVNNGIFKLGSGSLAENSAVTVNDGAGFDSRDGYINNYLDGKVTLKDGSRVFVDVSVDGDNPVIDQFASNAAATVTLSNINILGATDIPTGTVRLLSAGTVTGESLFVQDDGKTIAVQGSGENNGMIKIGMTRLSDKLNGAVYVSGAVDAITYKLTTDNEDVNPVGAYDALGTIQDSFIIKSSTPGTKKSLTAREGTFGLIVQAEKDLEVDDVVFKNFSTNDTYKGVITNYGTLTVKDSQFDMVEGNAKKLAIANYGTLSSDPTTYEGGIANYRGAEATISGDIFTGINRAGENGGAIFNEGDDELHPGVVGSLTVQNDGDDKATFINNVAANGGGIYNAGTATISNAVFGAVDTSGESPVYSDGNSAVTTSGGDGFGGAIYNSGSLTVTDTKFYANSAVKGGAIYSTADTTINATNAAVEFAGNTASTAGNDIYMEGTSGSPITLYLNSASDTNSITFNGGIDGSNYNVSVNNSTAGTVNIASLANAATLALNGGTTNITSDTTVTELTAADHTTLNASSANGLSTGTLTVDDSGTFINSGKLSVTSTLNNDSTGATGTITNTNAVLNLLGGTSATAPMTNIGSISGGNINIGSYTSDTVKDTAYVVNSGSITGEVSVAKKSTLQTAANTVNDSTGIANAGKLTLTGGNLASAVSGTGVTNVIGTVTNTDAKEIANAVEITNTGHLTTSTDALTSTTTTKNAGTLVFNNTTSEALNQSISDNDGIHGTVDIATATGDIIIDMTGKTITNNTIKLTRGTLKTGSDNGNVDLSSADKIEANGGTLSVQDGKTGTITLGNVDTSAGTLKFDIDVNLGGSGTPATADTLTLADGKAIGNDHGITISNIHIVDPDHGYQTEDYIMLADDTIGDILDVTKSELTVADGDVDAVKDLLINKVYEDGTGTRDQGTYLHTAHSDLDNAILSSIDDKMYFVGDPVIDNSAGALNLGGNSLSITGNNATITSSIDSSADPDLRQDGINIVDAGQTLTIQNAQIGDDGTGFDTAIDNSNGGTINLDGVTMTANNIDVLNDGEIDVTDPDNPVDHGVFLTGTNSINSIVDSDGSATHGQTTVKGGTSTINTIKQKSVTVDADATANLTNVDNVKTTDGITNDGDLVLAGGTADTPANNDNKITMTADAGNAKTTIASGSNIANNAEMTQKEVVVSATDGTNPAAILTNNDDIYANTVNIEDGATLNNNKNITASDVNVKSNADLNLNAGSNTLGDVTLDAADSELSITDDAVLAGDVKSDNNGQINLIADTQDIVMSDAITGNLTSVDGTDVGAYIINATTADPTGTDTSVTIDKAIAGATTINVSADTNAIITNVATDSNSSALVFANSNSEITLRNDSTTDDMNVGMSVFDASADGYELNTENTSPDTTISLKGNIVGADDVNTNVTGGTTNIDGSVNAKNLNAKDGTTNINGSANVADVNTEVGATTNINKNSNLTAENVNTNGGTTNINEKITAVNVNANGGDTNLNANGDSKTSDKLASAKVNIQNGANVNVNTDSDSMTIDNKVKGSGSTSNLILNGKQGKAGSGSNAGTQFNLGTAVDNANVVVSNGQLNLPDESKLANGSIVDVGSGATLNTISGKASDYNKDITFEDASQVKTDINANTGKADRFVNVIQGENDGVVLTDAELQDLDKVLRHTTKIDLAKATNLHNLTIGEELLNKTFTEMTAIRKMSAKFSEDGMLTIMPSSGRNNYDDFNPAVVVGPIAAQLGGYLSQLNSYDEAFRNLDMKMLMTREERKALKMANSYASEVQPQVFSSTYLPEKDSAGWFRPYASFEKVNLKYGPNAENTMYGSYFGGDSSMKELRNGWDYQYSVYVGYNGSHQNYQGNSIYQNGGNLGATAIWYKDDFFTALTANVGASVADASTYYGSENFPMLMTGIASKTGYNWELAKGKFIIQPSYLMSYTFVHTFDYTNAAGVKISSNPLNAINIAPGLKFIGNLKHGWQPYVGVQMVWNIMDKADYKANDIPLPQMSVKPYFQYGVGVQKRWGERFTGFVQAMMRNGGRNGIALSGGLRWAIGKDYHSYPDYTPKSKAKTTIKTNKDAKVTTSTDVIKKSKQDVTSKNITNETTNKVTKPTKKSKLSQFFAFMNGEPTYVVSVKTK